jgi:DNA-binding beta-propeller fold protein YncE
MKEMAMLSWRTISAVILAMIVPFQALALERSLYVINGLAETLSRADLQTGVVHNNIALLGLAPNQIFIDNERRRDTLGYITNSVSSQLQIVHLNTGATVRTIALGPDRNPYSLAFLDDSLVVVTNLLTNTLSEIDTRSGSVLAEYPVGAAPEGVVYHQGLLFVCLTAFDFGSFTYGQGQVAVVDPTLDSVMARIDVGTNPQCALIDFEDELLILCTGDFFSVYGMIYVVDPESRVVTDSIPTGGWPGHMALAPDGRAFLAAGGFVTDGEVYSFDTHTHAMLRDAQDPIRVGPGALGVATDIEGRAYSCDFSADRVSRIEADSVTFTYGLGDGPGFAAVYEPFPPGDADGSRDVTSADIIAMVAYVLKSGPAPAHLPLADVNRNCVVNASDIIFMVQFVFKNGPHPRYGCL